MTAYYLRRGIRSSPCYSNGVSRVVKSRTEPILGALMKIGSIKDIPCPFCQRPLFRLEFKQHGGAGDGQWLNAAGSPSVTDDEKGKFIQCAHCLRRVAFESDGDHPNPGFRIVPGQHNET